MNNSHQHASGLVISIFVFLSGCSTSKPDSFHATGHGGIVVTESDYATDAAIEILRSGGNAIDAAVTAAFVMAVTLPNAGNLGGGGFVMVREGASGDIWSLDFREVAPMAATTDMYVRLDSAGIEKGSLLGPLAAGIPGTPAGLHAMWERGGSLEWGALLRRSIELAHSGIVISPEMGTLLTEKEEDLGRFESTRSIFFEGSSPLVAGNKLTQPLLGNVLEQVALNGPAGFYDGPVAAGLVEDVREAGGIWSLEDLLSYRAVFREPVAIVLEEESNLVAYTMAPPASGALILAQSLAFLRSQDAFVHAPDTPERSAALIEAFRLAFADRNTKLADPDFAGALIAPLVSKAYLNERASFLPETLPGNSTTLGQDLLSPEPDNTTHLVVLDAAGNVVSLTYTLNGSFGSKWVSKSTGILLNNEMDDFETRPGKPNIYDLIGAGVNIVRPKARMLSSISPTIVMRAGEPWFALGGRGGPRIPTAVFQVIINRWKNGMDLPGAVANPRVHHQWFPDTVFFDEGRQSPGVWTGLRNMGYTVDTKPTLGRIMAAERLPDGRFVGVYDPRGGGKATAVK